MAVSSGFFATGALESRFYSAQSRKKEDLRKLTRQKPNSRNALVLLVILARIVLAIVMQQPQDTTTLQKTFRIILGIFMIAAAIGHLSFQRAEFQAQVPDWIPLSKDLVVIASGIVEAVLGLAMVFWKSQRINVGIALAIFYVLIFPGNIAQYLNHTNAFGLDTDGKRLARLFFQPVLILWALWSTGALTYLSNKFKA